MGTFCSACSDQSTISTSNPKRDRISNHIDTAINEPIEVCKDFATCSAIKRLVHLLQFYSTVNAKKNAEDQEKFLEYMENNYGCTQFLEDTIHAISRHNDDLQTMNEQMLGSMAKCNIKTCECTQRHFENENEEKKQITDDMLDFYMTLCDSMHFWFLHCFDGGFRVKKEEEIEKEEEDEEIENEYFDQELARLNKAIRQSDLCTAAFERISPKNNKKFTISTKTKQGDTTFCDQMLKHLVDEGIDSETVQTLKALLDNELFDTDSVKMDNGQQNIALALQNNQKCIQSIRQFIKSVAAISSTFSLGFRFYYWKYYEHLDELPAEEQKIDGYDNKHDHAGHKVKDLFVKNKYDSFKEEIASYKDMNIEKYEKTRVKVQNYMKTESIKKMKAGETDGWGVLFHYGTKLDKPLEFHHILSLTLYTDYTKLSTAFTCSFRKLSSFETIKSVKARNACYYWMSRYLRELVELFGQCSFGDTAEEDKPLDVLRGYFFTGMNMKLSLPSFAMRLNSPTSTSKQIEVALKFAGSEGVVITFDNPPDDFRYCWLRGWDCAWISSFKEEDEVLFFGGFHMIRVHNLRLIKTRQNLKKFMKALFEFDKMFNGSSCADDVSKDTLFIIENLIAKKLKKESKASFPPFVIDCFDAFTQNKMEIVFDMIELKRGDKRMNDLVFHPLEKRNSREPKNETKRSDDDLHNFVPAMPISIWDLLKNETERSDDDLHNLVRSEVFELFPNAKKMIIQTTLLMFSYSFSLIAFLKIISEYKLEQIVIKSQGHKNLNVNTWIKSVWESNEQSLIEAYSANNYKIEMKEYEEELNEYQ